MELLRGVTLKQYLAQAGGKGLAFDEVISFSQQQRRRWPRLTARASSTATSSRQTCLY